MKHFKEVECPKYFGFFENLLKKNGTGFFVGDCVSNMFNLYSLHSCTVIGILWFFFKQPTPFPNHAISDNNKLIHFLLE